MMIIHEQQPPPKLLNIKVASFRLHSILCKNKIIVTAKKQLSVKLLKKCKYGLTYIDFCGFLSIIKSKSVKVKNDILR